MMMLRRYLYFIEEIQFTVTMKYLCLRSHGEEMKIKGELTTMTITTARTSMRCDNRHENNESVTLLKTSLLAIQCVCCLESLKSRLQ